MRGGRVRSGAEGDVDDVRVDVVGSGVGRNDGQPRDRQRAGEDDDVRADGGARRLGLERTVARVDPDAGDQLAHRARTVRR